MISITMKLRLPGCFSEPKEWYAFIGTKASLGVPGSPYAINFCSTAPDSSGMKPMNVSTYSCGDTSLGCSCGDCPAASVCSSSHPPAPHRKGSCSVRIGTIKVAGMTFGCGYGFLLIIGALTIVVSLPYFIGSLFHRQIQACPVRKHLWQMKHSWLLSLLPLPGMSLLWLALCPPKAW